MSTLKDSLKELKNPRRKVSNFRIWLDSLDKEDRDAAIAAMLDTDIKNYPLFTAFKQNGMRVSKDYFINLRKEILAGAISPEGIR